MTCSKVTFLKPCSLSLDLFVWVSCLIPLTFFTYEAASSSEITAALTAPRLLLVVACGGVSVPNTASSFVLGLHRAEKEILCLKKRKLLLHNLNYLVNMRSQEIAWYFLEFPGSKTLWFWLKPGRFYNNICSSKYYWKFNNFEVIDMSFVHYNTNKKN